VSLTEWETLLDPQTAARAEPEYIPEGHQTVLAVWYVEPRMKQKAAMPMSEEQIQRLKALGYLR